MNRSGDCIYDDDGQLIWRYAVNEPLKTDKLPTKSRIYV